MPGSLFVCLFVLFLITCFLPRPVPFFQQILRYQTFVKNSGNSWGAKDVCHTVTIKRRRQTTAALLLIRVMEGHGIMSGTLLHRG